MIAVLAAVWLLTSPLFALIAGPVCGFNDHEAQR